MTGTIGKTEVDLTDEEQTKVNGDLVEEGLQMCSLRKELYCVEDPSSKYVGSCKACKDLESEPLGMEVKEQNRELCKHATKIAKAPKVVKEKEIKVTPPQPSSSSPSVSLNDTFLHVLLLVITTVIILKC